VFHPYGESIVVDRANFERRLEQKLEEEGGIVIEGRLHYVERTSNGGHAVMLQSLSGIQRCSARALVDATGIGAHVARRLGGKRVTNARQVAIGACFESPSGAELPATAVVESIPNGWLFAVPVAPGRAIIWLVCDPDTVAGNDAHHRALSVSQEIAQWLVRLQLRPTGEQVRRNASVGNLDRAVGDGWLAVGDAAISLDPLSSSGLTLAMLSGLHGGSAIACSLSGNPDQIATYARLIQDAAERHAALRQHFYRAEQRWPAANFWVRRREPAFHASRL
jgi:flavin-dependent dehydrogenase